MVDAPAIAVIFTSTRAIGDDEAYEDMSARMEALASQQDGFLGVNSVRDPANRRGITVSYWRDEDCARAWKAVALHRDAQRRGREHWYSEYEVVVARVARRYGSPGVAADVSESRQP
ncbi:MAG: antibiotic biosynthesis monooxygenase [Acidobacteriota bacterium]|nr:antibiotic biosynthesis monooxygenase [Acidobacteriota bacterium]